MTLSPYHRAQYTIVQNAYRIQSETRRLNYPTDRENEKIRAENRRIEAEFRAKRPHLSDDAVRNALRGRMRNTIPRPHRTPDAARKIVLRELRARRQLSTIPPEVWRDRIDALPTSVRKAAASIIWWDYFSERTSGERWPHLDDLLTQPIGDPPLEAIEAALIACGYPPFTAIIRIEGDASQRGRGRGWRHETIKEAA